jgi:hypothetical protein
MRPINLIASVACCFALLASLHPARAPGQELLGPQPRTQPVAPAADAASPLAPWRTDVKVSLVGPEDCHSIHSYYVSSPESPDGKWVLCYASTVPTGYEGELRIVERATGKVKVLATDITVEDAHRAACQQWASGGRRVVYHNVLKDNQWVVACVDVNSGEQHVLARNRQVGFGQPGADTVPIYSPHWAPGDSRDMELLDIATGETRKTPVTPDAVKSAYPDWAAKAFGERPMSIFFPVLSPDTSRVFFKIATPAGGDFRSKEASDREGLFCYDLKASRFLFMQGKWGHPAWNADSRQILNVGGLVTDSDTGARSKVPHWPALPGSHPSFSPDGKLYASDSVGTPFGLPAGWWAVGVGDARTGEFVVLAKFDNSKGARSWRVSHPHPVFSPDGNRLYFNVSDGPYTRLHVAEVSR